MSLNDIILAIGMLGLAIFMFNRELFTKPKSFRVILIISIIMLVLVYILPLFDTFKHISLNALKMPIITLVYYRILRGLFKKAFNREPKDTFWMMHWEKGIGKDTIFNLLFFFSWGIVYALLITDKI